MLEEIGLWRELAVEGRTEDENGNGALESSESFFFANPFRMCASFWQDMVDLFQIVRIIRSLDPAAVPAAIDEPYKADPARLMQNLLAADFNADGVLDIGGPDVQISIAGPRSAASTRRSARRSSPRSPWPRPSSPAAASATSWAAPASVIRASGSSSRPSGRWSSAARMGPAACGCRSTTSPLAAGRAPGLERVRARAKHGRRARW